MPTQGQMNAQQASMPAEMLAQIPQRRGEIMGGGQQMMTQQESSLIGQVAALRDEIAELRRMLSPPSAVILTGPAVAEQYRLLRPACTCQSSSGPDYCMRHAA